MRKNIISLMLIFGLSFGSLGKVWSYLFEPVNCVATTGAKLGVVLLDGAKCVWNNVTLQKGA